MTHRGPAPCADGQPRTVRVGSPDPARTAAELANEPMILLDVNPSRENTMMMYSAAGVRPHVRFRTTDYEVTPSLVARGMGYAILVQQPAGSQSYEGRNLVVRPIHPAPRRVPVSLVWPEAVQSSQCARTKVDLAAELYAEGDTDS